MKLESVSSVDNKSHPYLHSWDTEYRKNYADYQQLIDKYTYHLQRSQRGIMFLGQWNYPSFYQNDVLMLELYKNKQKVGKVFQKEIDQFKSVNPNIADDLNSTFNAKFLWPTQGLTAGLVFFGLAHKFNLAYSYRLGAVLLPSFLEYALRQSDKSTHFRTLEFLNWVQQLRTSKARIEYDLNRFNNEQLQAYAKEFQNVNLEDAYHQLIQLAAKQ